MKNLAKSPWVIFIINMMAFQGLSQPGSSPFLLDTNLTQAPVADEQRLPEVAFDGNVYLVAWTEFKSQPENYLGGDIYACRVDKNGKVLDPGGIPVCTAQRGQGIADVSFDGTNFIVLWYDLRVQGEEEIYFSRVTSGGKVLDPDGIKATTHSEIVDYVDVEIASGNNGSLILWGKRLTSGNFAVMGVRIDTAGKVLDTKPFAVSDTIDDDIEGISAGYDGTNYLVVWESNMYSIYNDLRGARVSEDGTVLDQKGFTIARNPDDQFSPCVAYGAGKFFVVWADDKGSSTDIYGTFVTPQGTVSDSSGFAINSQANDQYDPSVIFDGTNFYVSWVDRRTDWDVYGTGVTPTGIVLSANGQEIEAGKTSHAQSCDMVKGSNHILVVWENRNFPLEVDVEGARISISGYYLLDNNGIDISVGPYSHANPDVAFDGTNYLVVWEDNRNGNGDIYGTRVSPAGMVLDPKGIAIGGNDSTKSRSPKVTFDGSNFVVIWFNQLASGYSAGGYMTRVSPAGAVLDNPAITFYSSGYLYYFDIASSNNKSLIVWQDYQTNNTDIFGIIANQDGSLGKPFIVCNEGSGQGYPALSFNGSNYLAAWEDGRGGIYGTLVSANGVSADTNGVFLGDAGSFNSSPAVGSNGKDFLVAWDEGGSSGESVYGVRVNASGSPVGSHFLINSSGKFYYSKKADVAFDGQNYIVSWEEYNNMDLDYSVFAALVDTTGSPGLILIIDDAPGNQSLPRLAAGKNQQVLAAYVGWTEEINNQPAETMRTYGKFILRGTVDIGDVKHTDNKHWVYPNPASDRVTISTNNSNPGILQIYDAKGQKIYTKQLTHTPEKFMLDITNWKPGVYLLQIDDGTSRFIQKLIISK